MNTISDELVEYDYTMGVEFFVLHIDDKKMLIYDCSGNERYVYLTLHYVKNANIVVFVYAINNVNTFTTLQNLYNEHKRDNKLEDKKIVIVCNMIDIIQKKSEPYEKYETIGKEFSSEIGADFVMISSRTGENIPELFNTLLGYYPKSIVEEQKSRCRKIKECCSIL